MKKRIISYFAMLLTACVLFSGCTGTEAAGGLGAKREDAEPVALPYMQQDLLALEKAGRLSISNNMNKIAVAPDEQYGGVRFDGPAAHFKGGRVRILGTFDFDGNPVSRVSVSGVAEAARDVSVRVYLDEEKEPVAVIKLDRADGEKGWEGGRTRTQDVYGKIPGGTHRVSIEFDVEGAKGNEEASILLRSVEFAEASGIPVIYFKIDESRGTVDDMNQSEDHSVNCYGTIDIQVPEGFSSDYPGGISGSVADLAMDYVCGRGNSTWRAKDKKPYKFKLSEKTDLFGMGKSKQWALIANRFDNSLLRNRMTYWLGAELGMEFTPQCVPVDVVMNGEYYGSYLLAEQIRIDKSRVDIDELTEADVEEPAVTGGHLMAMSPYWDEDRRSVFTTEHYAEFLNENPDYAYADDGDFHGNDAQKDYIRGYVQRVEDAIFGDGFTDEDGVGYADFLDLDAAVDYWWIQEFSMNGDAYATDSTRLYKKRNGKLFFGPLWDFDYVAWGNLEETYAFATDGFTNTVTPWFDRLLADPVFTDRLMKRWPEIDEKISEIARDGGLLDRYYDQIRISERYDNEKYGFFHDGIRTDGENAGSPAEEDRTYEDEILQLKSWIRERQSWVNAHLSELPEQIKTVTFKAFDEVVDVQFVKKGKRVSNLPAAPEREGYFFIGWFTEDGREVDGWLPIDGDITVYGRYIDEESAPKADHLYFKIAREWADLNDGSFYPLFETTPADAVVNTVSWSSSDESVAAAGSDGSFLLRSVGTATVTGTLKSGYSASFELNVYDSRETEAIDCEGLRAAQPSLTVRQGESAQNTLYCLPEDRPLTRALIICQSDDPSIACVDPYGVVTGIEPGTTTVTVRDYTTDCSAAFEVTVLPEEGTVAAADPAAKALDTLTRLNDLIRPSDYTEASYAAYLDAFGAAVDRLERGPAAPLFVDDLRRRAIRAWESLERKEP